MAWRRREPGEIDESEFGARAVLVPLDARNTLDNESNLSADSAVSTRLRLRVRTEDGDGVTDGTAQVIDAEVPNWLRIVFHYAGTNAGPSARLPAEVELSVRLDPTTDRIVAVDIGRAEVAMAPYRPVATQWWKESEAPLADVRGLATLPRDALRGLRGLAGAWRSAAAELRADTRSHAGPAAVAHDDAEREQIRRTSDVVARPLADDPKRLRRVRASALESGPMMVANVRSGSMAMGDFDTWLAFQVGSGAITRNEADAWRADATDA